MNIENFLKKLPPDQRILYLNVFEAASTQATNKNVATQLGVPLSRVEQVRSDLLKEGLIKKRRPPYRQLSGLSPSRKKTSQPKTKPETITLGLRDNQTRHTFIIQKQNLENIRLLAHHDHRKINEFVDDLLSQYFSAREKDLEIAIQNRDGSKTRIIRVEK